MHQIAVERGKPSVLDKVFSLFANVRPGEGATALLLMANIFTLLTAYYIIKPVREALILAEAGAEIKSYASAGQAALFLLIVPLYGKFGSSVNRVWLINGVTAFFMRKSRRRYLRRLSSVLNRSLRKACEPEAVCGHPNRIRSVWKGFLREPQSFFKPG